MGGVVNQEYEKLVRKRVRQIGQVDLETGELLKGFATWTEVKYSPYSGGWFMQSQEALVSLAQDREVTGECYRVLFILLGEGLRFENYIYIPQTEIAQKLGM